MNCPVCGGKVIAQMTRTDCERVFRRRKCRECGYAFFTVETELNKKDVSKEMKGLWRKNKD